MRVRCGEKSSPAGGSGEAPGRPQEKLELSLGLEGRAGLRRGGAGSAGEGDHMESPLASVPSDVFTMSCDSWGQCPLPSEGASVPVPQVQRSHRHHWPIAVLF